MSPGQIESNYTQSHVLSETQGGAVMKISKTHLGLKDIPPDKLSSLSTGPPDKSFVVPEQLEIIDFIVNGLEMFLQWRLHFCAVHLL